MKSDSSMSSLCVKKQLFCADWKKHHIKLGLGNKAAIRGVFFYILHRKGTVSYWMCVRVPKSVWCSWVVYWTQLKQTNVFAVFNILLPFT